MINRIDDEIEDDFDIPSQELLEDIGLGQINY